MNPSTFPPSTPAVPGLESSSQMVRARLDAAMTALLQMRDEVVKALDTHLAELHGLQHVLAEADQQAVMSANPQPEMVLPPVAEPPPPLPQSHVPYHWQAESHLPVMPEAAIPAPDAPLPPPPAPVPPAPVLAALQSLQDVLLQKAPITPAPMPMSQVFPDRIPDFTQEAPPAAAVPPTPFSLRDLTPPSVSMPLPPPAALPAVPPPLQPIMNFQTAFTTVAPEPIAAPSLAERQLPPPSSVPLSRPLQAQVMPPLPPPSHVSQMTLPAPVSRGLPPPREMAREVAADPRMEQATLEDLNAALALAFSQASQPSRPLGQPSATMPAPVTSRPLASAPQWNLPPRH